VAKALVEMSVEREELFLTQAHWDEGVAQETQNGEEASSAGRYKFWEELQDIGIKAVVDMHAVGR